MMRFVVMIAGITSEDKEVCRSVIIESNWILVSEVSKLSLKNRERVVQIAESGYHT